MDQFSEVKPVLFLWEVSNPLITSRQKPKPISKMTEAKPSPRSAIICKSESASSPGSRKGSSFQEIYLLCFDSSGLLY